jgi:hypothetical protein
MQHRWRSLPANRLVAKRMKSGVAAGEVEEGVFEGSERVGVEVVGGLVEHEGVAAAAERLGEVDAVAFAAGEDADLLLLVAALDVEGCHVGARVHAVG